MSTGRVAGKTCVVTGAAQGIGAAIGRGLAREGANVTFADLNLELAESVAAEVRKSGGKAIACKVDVSKRSDVKTLIEKAVAEFGQLDVMFNNAGVNKPQNFLDTTEENWEFIMRINGLGVLIGIQEAAKQMIKQGSGGKIVNTASIAGRQGFDNVAPYCASKFAVISLTQSAARDLAKHHITVNGFSPGVVATPLWDQLDKQLMELGVSSKPGEAIANFSANILLGRPARPEDIVPTALFLASSDSDYVTGQIMAIDGGQILV
jgi:meso-butanediol dehydrogenase / (S,S)-butanediol dehydrogenase / diacetyl reductase